MFFKIYTRFIFVFFVSFKKNLKILPCRLALVANFKFKIISKILVYRLALVVARIISSNQYGFVQSKHI